MVRVAEILKRELSMVVLREIPAGGALITIHSVDVAPDLRKAIVFVGALGTAAQQRQALERLENNRRLLQAEVAKRVVLKFTPHLHFKLDASIERGSRVLDILEELGVEGEESDGLAPESTPPSARSSRRSMQPPAFLSPLTCDRMPMLTDRPSPWLCTSRQRGRTSPCGMRRD